MKAEAGSWLDGKGAGKRDPYLTWAQWVALEALPETWPTSWASGQLVD